MFSSTSLDDWLAHIQRVHFRSIDLTLERVASVWQSLDNGGQIPTIAVAGTNGKGSCVAMLTAIYQQARYRVGSYTSPHLVRYNERIAIDGQPCPDDEIIAALAEIETTRGDTPLTYFEFSTLAALLIFQQRKVGVRVLEVGMGGRLDAVNIIDNDAALITSIGLDHTAWLGETREQIATEKAGIFKPGKVAVCAEPDAPAAIADTAEAKGCQFFQLGRDFGFQPAEKNDALPRTFWWNTANGVLGKMRVRLPFPGKHQADNAAGVLAAVEALQPLCSISQSALVSGLENTRLSGRQQFLSLSGQADVLLDVSHNEDSIAALAITLRNWQASHPDARVLAVFGMLADKPIEPVIQALHQAVVRWFLCSLDGERGRDANSLRKAMLGAVSALPDKAMQQDIQAFDSPPAAYQAAKMAASADDLLLIFGSFHTVGAIIPHLQ